jgi:type III restriction enzyme
MKITFELHDYQKKAAQELTEKYWEYRQNPLKQPLPFLKLLSSVTGSGKTAILAQAVANLLAYYSQSQPLIFWLSCNKVVVQQTAFNLRGKYQSLIPQAQVKSFLEISPSDIAQLDTPLIYVDTIQKFSVQNKETRLIYQVQPDKGDKSAWELIKERRDYLTGSKRDLIVIYDEAHNLTDSQVEKILELQPQALILASGTPSLPYKLTEVEKELKDNNFETLCRVPFQKVKEKQMVKGKVVLGGYQSQMEEVLNEMLDKDWEQLKQAAEKEGLPVPKIIYVCKTNLLELSSSAKVKGSKRDNPQVLFDFRNAPPILIWRHLVKRKEIDPKTIAIYADIEVAREEKYALDIEFTRNLFNKGKSSPTENTYEKFISGNYQHIIFNKSLAEGWDDPMVYLAYIDKTIGSEVAVEQIIGRVLRQPFCKYYASEELNKAYFHIRIDENKVFEKIIDELNEKLKLGGDIQVKPPKGGVAYLKDLPPKPDKIGKKVPFLTWDSEYIQRKLQRIVNGISDYERERESFRQNIGKVQRTEKDLGDNTVIQDRIWEEDFGLANMVPAQVILRRVIVNKNTKVWNMLEWEDPKFKVEIGWGSEAEKELREIGEQLINTYKNESLLRISLEKPYEVGGIKIEKNPARCVEFKNAVHSKYSGLNNLERRVATELDNLGVDWCRNPTHYGYGIELIDEVGLTQNFFPDFLVWAGEGVICLEVTGDFLEKDKLERKLVRIAEPGEEMIEEGPKKVQVIILVQYGGAKEGQEIYYKVWYRKRRGEIDSKKVGSISEALGLILGDF